MTDQERREHQARSDAQIAIWADEHWREFEAMLGRLSPEERRQWVARVARGLEWLAQTREVGR